MYMYTCLNYTFMPCHKENFLNVLLNVSIFKGKAQYICEKVNIFVLWERDILCALCLTLIFLISNLTLRKLYVNNKGSFLPKVR